VKTEVRERAQEMKQEVRGRVEEKKQVASEKVHALARALRAAGDTLEDDGESALARYGRQAADQVERLASYIDGNDTSGMIRQFEHIARDNPAAFTGSTFAAGLLLGRFLRSSRPDDARDGQDRDERGTSFDTDAHTEPTASRGYAAGAYPGATGDVDEPRAVRSAGVGDAGASRREGTGFETPDPTFGSGAGHATTGGGSTAARREDKPEGGPRNG
jgi:hypothetical protein